MKVKQKPALADAVQYLGLDDPEKMRPAPQFSEPAPGWLLDALRGGAVTVSGMFTDALGVAISDTCSVACNKEDWLVQTDTGALAVVDDKTFRATYEALPPAVFGAPVASL